MVNTAHSESKDVMTKAWSFVPREVSEDQLELSTLTREAAVQEVGSSSPTTMQGRPVPRVTEIKCWILGVGPADSSVLDPRLRRRSGEEVQGAWLSQHGPVTLPGAPFSPGDNSCKKQRILHRPKMLVSGLLQSTCSEHNKRDGLIELQS